MVRITDPAELRMVYLSVVVVALSVVAIVVFAYGYNGIIFYAIALAAIAVGFYMSRSMSASRSSTGPVGKQRRS
jgi:hypothetical protein